MKPAGAYGSCGLSIKPREHIAEVHGRALDLTSREYEIVRRLVKHPGWVFSAEQLSSSDDEVDYSPESVSVLISRLRRKLDDAGAPDVVETVRGFGYRLRASSADTAGTVADADSGRRLRDAAWRVQEAVVEVEHVGSAEQIESAIDVLESACAAIHDTFGG